MVTFVDRVTLQVDAGERVAILGPNGAGKTTLFNAITGMLRPSSGSVVKLGTATPCSRWKGP